MTGADVRFIALLGVICIYVISDIVFAHEPEGQAHSMAPWRGQNTSLLDNGTVGSRLSVEAAPAGKLPEHATLQIDADYWDSVPRAKDH